MDSLARALAGQGRHAEAIQAAEKALAIHQGAWPEDEPSPADVRVLIGQWQAEGGSPHRFDNPTYIILPIQPPIADQVLALRKSYGYPLAIPVEVTVAGSSGVGVLEPDQDPEAVLETLRTIAADTAPFTTAYGEVRRFPGTSIFWFSLQDEAPFRAIHQRLKESGLRFGANPSPYQPHCTLQTRRRTEAEVAELLAQQVTGPIRFGEIALAALIERPGAVPECPVLWRTPLTGA